MLRFLPTILCTVGLGFVCFFPSFSSAQVSYTVTPRVIDVTAAARDIITRTITIENTGVSMTSIFPSVNEITLDEGGDITEFKGPTAVDRTSAVTSWIEIPRKEIRIAPGETGDVTMTIRMNPNTQPGEYHALLGFGYGRIRDDAENQVKAGRAPSIVVTIRVEDTSVERVDLAGFVIDKFITSNNNEAVSYTLKNPGDTTVIPQGEIIVYDDSGKEVATIVANPDNISLAPGEEKKLTSPMPTDGLIGQYKGFLSVSYGAAQAGALYDTAFFYVLPWQKILLIFLVVAFVAVALTIYLYRRYGITDEDDDDAHRLEFKFKDATSNALDHDINLKK